MGYNITRNQASYFMTSPIVTLSYLSLTSIEEISVFVDYFKVSGRGTISLSSKLLRSSVSLRLKWCALQ